VVTRVFQHLGYSAINLAENGNVALDFIDKNGMPDLVLMDVQMYEMK
jgi:CheY-like chemotaxis protein